MLSDDIKEILLQKSAPAGCDEAGRGCLAGPVYAAAVILPADYFHPLLKDSKRLSEKHRNILRAEIEREAISFGVARVDETEIDTLNILWASVKAMHLALDKLTSKPDLILVDGNRFRPYQQIPHRCIVGGDNLLAQISAASVLAKTYRDEFMMHLHHMHPQYGWDQNKGYPTDFHRQAIAQHGQCTFHRKSFQLHAGFPQGELPL
jgi:ribonuclease HII